MDLFKISKVFPNNMTIMPTMLSENQSYNVLKVYSQVLECKVEILGKLVVLWRKGDRILSVGKLEKLKGS